MIRPLSAVLLTFGLAACQPATEAQFTAGEAIPDTYDWAFTPHGGSADLDYGDGDRAEGAGVFHLSCLPNSQSVTPSWASDGEAVLTSATATGTFRADAEVPADHPVLQALRRTGNLAVGLNGADMTLEAKPAGKARLEAFFAYCTTPLPPPPEPVGEAAPPPADAITPPSEGDDQADDLSGVEPVEPGVDVVEGDGAAHQPVDR
jgi:hypothetical protein